MILACLALDGRRPQSASNATALEYAYGSAAALERARIARDHHRAGRFKEAVAECQRGYAEGVRQNRPRAALFYLNTLASAHYNLGEYRKAQETYITARELGLASGMPKWSAFALANLSSLYMHASDTDSALAAAEEAHALSAAVPMDERSEILLQLGRVLLHRGDAIRAHPLFSEAIRMASERGDCRARAAAWDQLGLETMQRGLQAGDGGRPLLQEAHQALRRALFLRKISRDPNIFATEQKLAHLELSLGNVALARQLIDSAFARPNRNVLQLAPHLMFLTRAQVLAAQGEWQASLKDYARAIEAAEEWRGRSLFADSFRISADIWLHQIYEGAVTTAARRYQETGEVRFAELAWEFAERSRSASLREGLAVGRDWAQRVPEAYWRKLERLRVLETEHFSGLRSTTASGDEATRLRMQLAEMEASAGAAELVPTTSDSADDRPAISEGVAVFGENNPNLVSLRDVRKTLGERRVLISFVLGEGASYRWVVSREGLDMKVLAKREQIVNEVETLRSAIRNSDPNLGDLSRKAYAHLFGGIRMDRRTHWHIAMDDRLFDLPVAALVAGMDADGAAYLIERQSFDFVPGAWALGSRTFAGAPRRFVGIGDGIYNTADPRYPASAAGTAPWFRLLPTVLAGDGSPLQLPRLAGSSAEVAAAAAEFGADAVLLTGTRVSRKRIIDALSEIPQYIHIASHFLVEREGAGIAAVVLGVAPDQHGRPELKLLTARDIANLRVPGSVVVMSGCSSGSGRIVPTAGVLGLARSWLAAGARAVVATQWPTLDDSGEIFTRFYAHMARTEGSERVTPAEALRRAQIDMLRSGTWRSEPKYWAAYQVIERSN
jgi:CHAT domain-containing protein/tetratricopeptide (TPR) repeat protein